MGYAKPPKPIPSAPFSSGNQPDNRPAPPSTVLERSQANSQAQLKKNHPHPPSYASLCESEAAVFFPSLASPAKCYGSSHSRHRVGDGSEIYFSTFNSFLTNRTACEQCGLVYSGDIAQLIESDADVDQGVRDAVETGSIPEQAQELALRVELNRAYFHLARLQVQYAMGVLVDSLKSMEVSEVVAHRFADTKPEAATAYLQLLPHAQRAVYQGMFYLQTSILCVTKVGV
jgi:hypothetical protein